MSPIEYYQLIKNMKSSFDLRLRMVQYALRHSKSEASRVFGTTRDTVRKWVERYLREGPIGLLDISRRPKNSPRKIPAKKGPEAHKGLLQAF